jgi:UDP-N-acetylglucosamine 2-epimerase (non-hydrolysing)
MYIGIILGTRPEIIKFSPVIRELKHRGVPYFIIDTNQHYDDNMSKVFFKELELPKPRYNLKVGSKGQGEQTGEMLRLIEDVLLKERPEIILVQGDTNTALAGALAATKIGIKVGHIEAGLRSYDRTMPEETNRVIIDHISDYLFAPTRLASKILINEGIDKHKIIMAGNTIVDAVGQNKKIANRRSSILDKLGLVTQPFMLFTLHRPANVDNKITMGNILKGLSLIGKTFTKTIIFPIHPRTRKMVQTLKLKIPSEIRVVEPIGYLDFLVLEEKASLILTDSGGIQEEACIFRVPCITIRENTERPETLRVRANYLAGTSSKNILTAAKTMERRSRNWINPFGDGRAAERIVSSILNIK